MVQISAQVSFYHESPPLAAFYLLNINAPIPPPGKLYFLLISHSLVAQMVQSLPAVQETWVQSLGQENPLEKEMATHYSILSWRIPWTEEPGRLQSRGSLRVGQD